MLGSRHAAPIRRPAALRALVASLLLVAALVCWLAAPAGAIRPRAAAAAAPAPQQRNSEQPPLRGGVGQASSASEASTIAGLAVAAAPTPDGLGFWVAWSNGAVTAEGDAKWYGDMAGVHLTRPVVGIAATADGHGYWLLASDGGVFSFGDAVFHGSTGNMVLHAPALQMMATHDGKGYDFVAGDGGIFTFGDATFYGSTGGMTLDKPVVGMASTPDGRGYWLVASDGGIFTFGDARFHGSTGSLALSKPVVAMASTSNGGGYWLLASDGGIFSFGNAAFHGSGATQADGSPAVSLVATGDGAGYWIVLADGRVLAEGDAQPMSGPTSAGTQPASSTSYAFEVTNASGQPARWNPSEGVPYAVITAGAPAGWQNDISGDIAQAQAATGLSFTDVGAFSTAAQVPATAKLTISWSSALTGGDTVGLATYYFYNLAGYVPQIVSAKIQLLSSLPAGDGSGEEPVLLHELGHAMGLGHTPGAAEVMNPYDIGLPTYQLGDLNGLWHVGAAQGSTGFYQQ
jgi:hypothetical protein